MLKLFFTTLASAFLISHATNANDSSATLEAGGLVLTHDKTITMQSEDLRISRDEITVDYEFHNNAPHDKQILVAFPMPDMEYTDGDISIPQTDSDNFMAFTATADGQAIAPKLEKKAMRGKEDITASLLAKGQELNPAKTIPENDTSPDWHLQTTYYWQHLFKANSTTKIHHRYLPSVGSFFVGKWIFEKDMVDEFIKTYCIDEPTRAALMKILNDGSEQGRTLSGNKVAYILTSGANWDGPIEKFRLVIDKGTPQTIVSFCMDGVKKISPTKFEIIKKNYTPDHDLKILFVTPPE